MLNHPIQLSLDGAAELSADPIDGAIGLIDRAIERYKPAHVFALLSGGHDSLCAAHVTSQHPRFDGAVHINTGIGIEATRQFVRQTCERQGWSLLELRTPPEVYVEQFVMRYGFPGPAQHLICYTLLKERRLEELARLHRGEVLVLTTGVRKQESQRRLASAGVSEIRKHKRRVFANVILPWRATDKLPYMAQHGLARNPVVDKLCMSGECLCGAFANNDTTGELNLIAEVAPDAAGYIRGLQDEARRRGITAWKWGQRPPVVPPKEQLPLPLDGAVAAETGPLCWSCDAKRDERITFEKGASHE